MSLSYTWWRTTLILRMKLLFPLSALTTPSWQIASFRIMIAKKNRGGIKLLLKISTIRRQVGGWRRTTQTSNKKLSILIRFLPYLNYKDTEGYVSVHTFQKEKGWIVTTQDPNSWVGNFIKTVSFFYILDAIYTVTIDLYVPLSALVTLARHPFRLLSIG